MTQSTEDTTLAGRCNVLLTRSIEIYQQVFDHYQALAKEVPDSAQEQIQQRLVRIDSLYIEVRSIDGQVAEIIASLASPPESTSSLLSKRDDLLASTHEANRNLVKTADKAKSLLLHEIKSMHTGRNALQGYGNAAGNVKKNIVNGSF